MVKAISSMELLSENTPIPSMLRSKSAEQEVIRQFQSELLALIRVAPDEGIESWQTPVRLGDWSRTLEIEICHFLW